jgi:hypothetical protein
MDKKLNSDAQQERKEARADLGPRRAIETALQITGWWVLTERYRLMLVKLSGYSGS